MPKQTDSIELTNSLQGTVEYTASQEIIPEEKILEQGSFTYTSNGERTENPSEGYDGFSQVAVNVNVQPNLQSKSVSYTENNDYTISPDDGYQGLSSVAVNVNVPQGPVEAPENDVEFIDYDGTIVYSYTAQEFLALDAMPANPTHEGLTAQGWNWTLADAKEYVGDYGGLVIGQMYITDDGKTRLYVELIENRLSPSIGICVNGTATIEWGDGTTSSVTGSNLTTTINTQHTYSSPGKYVVKIMPPEAEGETWRIGSGNYGSPLFYAQGTNDNRQYQSAVLKIEFGKGITAFGIRALQYLYNLSAITMPKGVTVSLVFCDSTPKLNAIIVSQSNSQFGIGSSSFNCGAKRISLPKTSITSLATNCCNPCYGLRKIYLPGGITSISDSAFRKCQALEKVVLPNSLTSIGNYAFEGCTPLREIIIPDSVATIGNYAFNEDFSLTKITIGSSVTSIGGTAFYSVFSASIIKFKSSAPPTLSSSNSLSLPTDCVIYVPYSEDHSVLNAYKTATNYPNPSTYTYVEY